MITNPSPVAALIGLGKMGANMVRRLARAGVPVAAFDVAAAARATLGQEARVSVAATLADAVALLPRPRVVWLMLPAGEPSETTLTALAALLAAGDVIVDGANADYRDSMRHAAEAAARGVLFVDAGVSGGVWGLANGYGLMLGGTPQALAPVLPLARARARPRSRLGALRAAGRGPLRQDGPQRHRIRTDAGLRRGLRADARQA